MCVRACKVLCIFFFLFFPPRIHVLEGTETQRLEHIQETRMKTTDKKLVDTTNTSNCREGGRRKWDVIDTELG